MWFVLAASLASLGEREQALTWFHRGRAWIDDSPDLIPQALQMNLANEAAELLGFPAFRRGRY